jgi:hypothetical protein
MFSEQMIDASLGLSAVIPRVGGIRYASSAKIACIVPANPLVASVCPMLGFIDPINSGLLLVLVTKTLPIGATLMGSPTGVPVLECVSASHSENSCRNCLPVRYEITRVFGI